MIKILEVVTSLYIHIYTYISDEKKKKKILGKKQKLVSSE